MEQLKRDTFVARPERRQVSLGGFALSATRDSDIVVSDLSYAGCQFRSADSFSAGERVELRIIKRGSIQAEIRWAANGRAGACFVG